MRLDKFLVACAVGSRTEVKNLLKAGRVTVNGKKEKSAKLQIDEERDEIRFDGQVLEYEEFVYYMMNKPQGVISATEDPKHRTVLDLLDDIARSKEVFPVGRLDIDTHGLLLLTNDGKLAHALLSPKRHVDKTYLAQVKGIMAQESKPNPCDHCRREVSSGQTNGCLLRQGNSRLATFDYGNSSIG